jgi:DNA-binding IscR family transcriptional regulator
MSGNWNKINLAVRGALENVTLADMASSGSARNRAEAPAVLNA